MNTDQLKNGLEIQRKLEGLKKHLGDVEACIPTGTTGRKDFWIHEHQPLLLNFHYEGDSIGLEGQFLNMEEFLLIYKSRVKAEIEKLEKEFESI